MRIFGVEVTIVGQYGVNDELDFEMRDEEHAIEDSRDAWYDEDKEEGYEYDKIPPRCDVRWRCP